jgi:hypothetical protein
MGLTPKCHFVSKLPNVSPKFLKVRNPTTLGPISLCADLWLRWSLKQSCSPRRKLFNNMWHTTYTQGNQSNFWLWMVENQVDNLTPRPYFGHNLCFKCPNGSCEPILDIYIPFFDMDMFWHTNIESFKLSFFFSFSLCTFSFIMCLSIKF